MPTRLQLHCHTGASKFALVEEGKDWREEFDSLEDALKFAASIASDSTPIVVLLDEDGAVIPESRVRPDGTPP